MKVKQLIKKLQQYNPNARIAVVAHNTVYEFTICFGCSEGVKKANCEEVDLFVDELCKSDNKGERG